MLYSFFLGDSPASEFYVLTFRNTLLHLHRSWMEQTECSETSAHKIQRPGYHPKERREHSRHGECSKSRKISCPAVKVSLIIGLSSSFFTSHCPGSSFLVGCTTNSLQAHTLTHSGSLSSHTRQHWPLHQEQYRAPKDFKIFYVCVCVCVCVCVSVCECVCVFFFFGLSFCHIMVTFEIRIF